MLGAMSDSPPTTDAPRRRRRQFSLRTLCLVVLGYTLGWGVTINWGVPGIRQHAWVELEQGVSPDSRALDFNPHERHNPSARMPYHYVTAFSPCPFVVYVSSGWMARYEYGNDESFLCFWFFGVHFRVCVGGRAY